MLGGRLSAPDICRFCTRMCALRFDFFLAFLHFHTRIIYESNRTANIHIKNHRPKKSLASRENPLRACQSKESYRKSFSHIFFVLCSHFSFLCRPVSWKIVQKFSFHQNTTSWALVLFFLPRFISRFFVHFWFEQRKWFRKTYIKRLNYILSSSSSCQFTVVV